MMISTSSDEEDDQDEEELLQRALAEQAQRDVRYAPARPPPPSRKAPPPPPSSSQQRQAVNRVAARPAPAAMDDDESEVELLSISSDDDDAPRPAAAAAARRPADEDLGIEDFSDEDEVEEEPRVWSKVNEQELHRRVRDMRETRVAPGLRRPTFARKGTVAGGDAYPRDDLIDPLGLGTIDLKTLTLISDASSPGAKAPVQDAPARDPASREKVLYHSEKFDPKFFLARIHQRTKASDLEHGDAALKVDLQNRKQQLKLLVKENFECFVSCKTTIDDIHSKLQQIESDSEGAGTAHLTHSIQDVDEVAKRAFGPLLERQAQAERIRSVQGMLQRFRTLFNLPSAIRSNISKGEFDMAVREYKKTKSLVLPSHGKILKRVFEEVEKVVQELKDMLSTCMEDPHADSSQLENSIRLLLELDPDSDPVWQYLSMQERRIRGILEACVAEHEIQMDILHGRLQQKLEADARWRQLQSESSKTSEIDISLFITDQGDGETEAEMKEFIDDESDALLGRLIRRLTTVIIKYVPDFWRLALSIFKGKFAKVSRPGAPKEEPEARSDESYPFEEKPVVVVRYTTHSLDEVVAMVQGIIGSYESKVHTAFTTLADATVMRGYMREALGEISKASVALSGKDCCPTGAVQTVIKLEVELMQLFISKFCSLMRQKASELMDEEDWMPVSAVERDGSPFAISSLPLKLRDLLNSTIEHMKEVLDKVRSEPTRLENLPTHIREMQACLQRAFLECFIEVIDLIDKKIVALAHAGVELTESNKFVGLQVGVEVSSPHQKLLMALSNLAFMKNELFPDLCSKHEDVWTQERSSAKEPLVEVSPTVAEVIHVLSNIEEKIITQYNFVKAAMIGPAAALFYLGDGIQWASAPPVKGIRDAAVELVHPLVAVHAEVYAGARNYVRRIICDNVVGFVEALISATLNECLSHLDMNGFCQLMLELDYLESVLNLYCTSAAKASFASLRETLLQKVQDGGGGESAELSGHHRRPTRGSEDDEGMQAPASMDDILARAEDVKSQYLSSELKRTRVNVICFLENADSIPSPDTTTTKGAAAAAAAAISPTKATAIESSNSATASPRGRHRRRSSGSFSDEPGKPFPGGAAGGGGGGGLPPLSPLYSSNESANNRFSRPQPRTVSRRTSTASSTSSNFDEDLR